jgi:hypothetical protein
VIEAPEIARRLADRIVALVRDLLPEGHREGHEWRIGSVRGEPGDSLSVHLRDPKAGVWADFATGECGDALDLVKAVHRCDLGDALTWSRRWLGIVDAKAVPPPRPAAPKATTNGNGDHWRRIWESTKPIAKSIAETYLATRKLPVPPRLDEVLRFHPACPFKGEKVPALVALWSDIRTDEPCGIHRTALRSDGTDRNRTRGKAMLGRAAGAAIKLSPDGEVTLGLGLVEGIETGLAIIGTGWQPVWAAGSAGAIAQFPILSGLEELTIFADRDGAGQQAAQKCARRWSGSGTPVTIRTPFDDGTDWCDPARIL